MINHPDTFSSLVSVLKRFILIYLMFFVSALWAKLFVVCGLPFIYLPWYVLGPYEAWCYSVNPLWFIYMAYASAVTSMAVYVCFFRIWDEFTFFAFLLVMVMWEASGFFYVYFNAFE